MPFLSSVLSDAKYNCDFMHLRNSDCSEYLYDKRGSGGLVRQFAISTGVLLIQYSVGKGWKHRGVAFVSVTKSN